MNRNAITCTAAQMEKWADEGGLTITMRPDHAELKINGRLFVAPLPIIPAQRSGDDR